MKIELLKDWTDGSDSYSANILLEVDEITAKDLIEEGTAKQYREVAPVEEKASVDELVAAAVKTAIEGVKTEKTHIEVGKQGIEDDPKLGFKNFGHFAIEVKSAGEGMVSNRIKAVTGLAEGTDSLGGHLVPPEFASTLIEKVHNTGQVWDRVSKFPVDGSSMSFPSVDETSRVNGSRLGGIRGFHTEEAGQQTNSNPTLGLIQLRLNKIVVSTPVTDELMSDVSGSTLAVFLSRALGSELGFVIDDDLINGTGAGQALGLLNANATVEVGAEDGQTANTIQHENIVAMHARLWAPSRAKAVWFINQDIEPQLHTMSLPVGTGGIPTYLPANGLADAPFAVLFGHQVIPIEQCATLGTAGDIILADMSEYIGIEKGIETASSIHLRFDFAEEVFRAVIRMDAQPAWESPLTPFKGTNTLSPFITLATRA